MIGPNIEKAINEQINAELFSAYIYKAMSAYFASENLMGMSRWMDIQSEEEMSHAMKFYDYLVERGGRVKLTALEEPPFEWDSPLSVFEAAYEHEQYISSRINHLTDLAISEKDHATNIMLQWFVSEQVEEEAHAEEIVNKLKMISESRHGLYMLDRELGAREAD
ncbi:MAG TPA: ferritin [Synergistales bacterium]|nr:ferritin [Synergistales bacterium]